MSVGQVGRVGSQLYLVSSCCCYVVPGDFLPVSTMASPGGLGEGDRRTFQRDLSLIVVVGSNSNITAKNIIDAVEAACGLNTILACVPKGTDQFEITVADKEANDLLAGGIQIGEEQFPCREVASRTLVVSFLHLSSYVTDDEIYDKLYDYGVEPVSNIRRRFYPGTRVADGTRYLRVKMPPEVKSLPYAMRFTSGTSSDYYRVVHDNQKKVCSMCLSDQHLYRDCPKFVCYHCSGQGHIARSCKEISCDSCGYGGSKCKCSPCNTCGFNLCSCSDSSGNVLCDTCYEFNCVCEASEPIVQQTIEHEAAFLHCQNKPKVYGTPHLSQMRTVPM